MVFGRPESYRTDDDNIVRNYARQLRRRLAKHFEEPGRDLPLRIEVPVGGYVPLFAEASDVAAIDEGPGWRQEVREPQGDLDGAAAAEPDGQGWPGWPTLIPRVSLLIAGVVTVLIGVFSYHSRVADDPARALWQAILPASGTTYVVPTDAGFNLIEDMARRSLPLGDYIKGQYGEISPMVVDEHTRQDLATQQYTDLVSLQFVAMLARRREFDPKRVLIRFPRDLRIDDLKKSNAVIIGSATSNPWASLGDEKTDFRITPKPDMQGASIEIAHPAPGEQASYESHWGEPAHETFALILLEPNLSATGYLLLVEGLDIAGTQAATELLFSSAPIAQIVERARRKDGSLRPFEVLVRATSLQSNAEGTQIIASRVH